MTSRQGARLIRIMFSSAYNRHVTQKGLCRHMDENSHRKRLPSHDALTARTADDAKRSARGVFNPHHWHKDFHRERARMMAELDCSVATSNLWHYNIDLDSLMYPLEFLRPLVFVGCSTDQDSHFFPFIVSVLTDRVTMQKIL